MRMVKASVTVDNVNISPGLQMFLGTDRTGLFQYELEHHHRPQSFVEGGKDVGIWVHNVYLATVLNPHSPSQYMRNILHLYQPILLKQ